VLSGEGLGEAELDLLFGPLVDSSEQEEDAGEVTVPATGNQPLLSDEDNMTIGNSSILSHDLMFVLFVKCRCSS
jgi:hypothetical protein